MDTHLGAVGRTHAQLSRGAQVVSNTHVTYLAASSWSHCLGRIVNAHGHVINLVCKATLRYFWPRHISISVFFSSLYNNTTILVKPFVHVSSNVFRRSSSFENMHDTVA